MAIIAPLPPYPSKNVQKTLPRSQISTLNHKIAHGLAQVLGLPPHKRDDQSCRDFVASYAQDTACRTLEALIWGKNDDLDLEKWAKDEKLIRQRTLLLAERLAATKASNSASLDLQTLLDLSIVFYPTHPSRIRALFSTALATSPSLRFAVEMETVPAFTQLFSSTDKGINTGLYALRKTAQCLKLFIVASPPAFTRLFALNKGFVVALADVYHRGLSSLAVSHGFTGSEDDPNDQDIKIFVETKVALMDSFRAMIKDGIVDAVVSGENSGVIQEVLEVLLQLANLPAASLTQLPSHTTSVESIPFFNRSLLEDYDDAYDFTETLTSVLRDRGHDDTRLDRFEAHLRSIRAAGGNERQPGALRVLLQPSEAPLPRIDRKGKGRADPDRTDTPPPLDSFDDLDLKVTQVLDVLPDTPLEYVRALLQHPDYPFKGDPERVVGALLEGTAPPIEDLNWTTTEPPQLRKPAQERLEYTEERRNIFDDQEMDLARVHIGKKSEDASALLQDKSEIERMKADILRRVEEVSDEDEGSDGVDYDEGDVIRVKLGGDGEESDDESGERPNSARDIDTILELAYIADPKQFDRDAQTRRSQARVKLKAQTGLVDEQIEGWKVMLERNPKKEKILQKHEFSGNKPGLIEPPQGEGGSRRGPQMGEGSRPGRGFRGRGDRGGGRGGRGGGDTRDRSAKEQNKASRGNHNRKRGHDKKMARTGPPPT